MNASLQKILWTIGFCTNDFISKNAKIERIQPAFYVSDLVKLQRKLWSQKYLTILSYATMVKRILERVIEEFCCLVSKELSLWKLIWQRGIKTSSNAKIRRKCKKKNLSHKSVLTICVVIFIRFILTATNSACNNRQILSIFSNNYKTCKSVELVTSIQKISGFLSLVCLETAACFMYFTADYCTTL